MADFNEMKRNLSRIEKLEHEVNLKQLQINSLLAITQAINDNVAADALYAMFNNFLRWEMGIRRMALFIQENGRWECKTSLDVPPELLAEDITPQLARFKSMTGLENHQHPLFQQFDLVIPVLHKTSPVAYAFVGGFNDHDDVYNKVQFIVTITNVIAVAIENKRLFKRQLRQEVLNREVELAAEIQRTLVPARLPSGKKYQLSSIYKPHFAVGGDYFDVVEFPGEKLILAIADITGKGVSAAMLMANFQASLHGLIHRGMTLEEVVQELNRSVFRVTQGERFITMFLAKYDSHERTLHYVNAGHTPPYLVSGGQIERLRNGTTVLGFLPELPFLEIGGLCLTGESLLFTYTDGLTDIQNRKHEEFGEENLGQFLLENEALPAKDLNNALLASVEKYRERVPFPDDITVLTCKVFGK